MTPNFFSMKLLRFTYLGALLPAPQAKNFDPHPQNTLENAFPGWRNVLE